MCKNCILIVMGSCDCKELDYKFVFLCIVVEPLVKYHKLDHNETESEEEVYVKEGSKQDSISPHFKEKVSNL